MTPRKKPRLEAQAPPPARTYRTTNLTLGLIPIEVSIFSSLSEPRSLRQRFVKHEDGYHPLGVRPFDKVTGENLEEDGPGFVKGIQTEDGVIEISDDELELQTEKVCEVVQFINLSQLSAEEARVLCPIKFYQVRPATIKVGRDRRPNRQAEKALLLMLASMQRLSVHALLRVTLNDGEPPKLGLLDHGGQLRILAFEDAVRQDLPLGELNASEDELKMMDKLVKSMIGGTIPPNPDMSAAHLEKVIQAKEVSGQAVQAVHVQTTAGMEVPQLDLQSLIDQSIQQAGK